MALGVIYSVTVPIFEARDELYHYPYVAHLAQGGSLPVQQPGEDTFWQQEGSQPPLYYALACCDHISGSPSTTCRRSVLNPHARIGIPLAPGNKNMVIHTDREAFPWHGTMLAVHLVRILSLLLALGTVMLTYGIALELYPDRPGRAAGAMAVHAVHPDVRLHQRVGQQRQPGHPPVLADVADADPGGPPRSGASVLLGGVSSGWRA